MSKLYQKKAKIAKESNKKATTKAAEAKKLRRSAAVVAFTVPELLRHYNLVHENNYICPKCKESSINGDKHSFHCSNCKTKGNTIKLAKLALNSTDWGAIKYIEELMLSKSNADKPTDVIEVVSGNETTAPTIASPLPETSSPEVHQHSRERVDRIKAQHKMSSILQKYAGATLKKVGNNLMCRCPFPDHEDKTPSFSVDDGKGLFHCFGCGRKGDVLGFVRQYRGCSFVEAMDLLDPGCGDGDNVPFKLRSGGEIVPQARQYALLQRCNDYFHRKIADSREAQEFLRERGLFASDLVSYFHLGFDDGSINQILTQENIADLQEIGFVNGNNRCRFYKCLTVPLTDMEGSVVNIYGRRVNNNKGSKHQFPKSNQSGVFNLKAFQSATEIILTEGIVDGMSLWRMGFHNVSSIFSASNIPTIIIDLLVKYGIKRLYLALDNDDAGQRARVSIANKLHHLGIEVRSIAFPAGIKDANEFLVKHGIEQGQQLFADLLAKATVMATTPDISQAPKTAKTELHITWEKKKAQVEGGIVHYEIELYAREKGTLRVLMIATKGATSHTDKLDLFRSQARNAFAYTAGKRFHLAGEKIEEELEQILMQIRRLPKEFFGSSYKGAEESITTYTEDEKKEALEWLKKPGFFNEITKDYDMIGYVGETEAKEIAYLSASSRKLENPLPLIIRASSAGGKSALMEVTAKLMPDEDVIYLSEISKQALYYMSTDRIRYKLIIVDERRGSEEADYAIRTLLSRGLLRKAVPVKELDGEMRTIIKEILGPIAYMESTTSIYIDPENENRCIVIFLDDSREQNQRIQLAQKEYYTPEGREKQRQAKNIITRHKVAQKLLKPCKIDIPYVSHLTFPTSWCRTRRDHQKFLRLLSTITYIHQYQRKQYLENKELIVVSQPEDYKIAYRLAPLILRPAVSDLTDKHHELLEGIDTYISEKSKSEQRNKEDIVLTRSEIARAVNWQLHQIKSYLPQLVDTEYLILLGNPNRGSTFRYLRNYQIANNNDPLKYLLTPDDLERKLTA